MNSFIKSINVIIASSTLSDSQKVAEISKITAAATSSSSKKQVYEAVVSCEENCIVLRAAFQKSKALEKYIRNHKFLWDAAKRAHVRNFASADRAIAAFDEIEELD